MSASWWDLRTPAGRFTLSPVKPARDLDLLHRWMNDPVVARYWGLGGPIERTAQHVAEQAASGHSGAYLARLSGRAIGYWEVYHAADDCLADHYDADPDDIGVHLLIGEPDVRGRGLAGVLLRAFCEAEQDGTTTRVVAEPDERNTASLRAFAAAGFAFAGCLDLPEKRAVLMIREAGTGETAVPAQAAAAADVADAVVAAALAGQPRPAPPGGAERPRP